MNTALISFGIRSVVRLGRISSDALEQQARDAPAVFPLIQAADFNAKSYVAGFFTRSGNKEFVIGDDAPYAEFWNVNKPKSDAASIDALLTAAMKIDTERAGGLDRTVRTGAAVMVRQWSDTAAPVSPWARIILAAGDIVLEYVAANPSVIDGDGTGEKLIAAYARNLSELLPDDGEFGAKEQFLQRLAGAFLRAGLSTATENPRWLASEDHVAELIKATAGPLRDAFPDDITEQLRWHAVTDALVGPAATAALRTMAEHQVAFLGDDFDPDRAAGALTRAVFLEAAESGLQTQFTKDGLLGLYAAVLGVAAEQPQLFIRSDGGAEEAFARDIFAGFMTVLKDAPPPFDREVGLELAGVALDTVGRHVHRFAGTSDWQSTAADLLKAITDRLSRALADNEKLRDVFTSSQLTELGRVLLTNIAGTPRMVLGSGNEAWEGVLRAVASAMAADEELLLGGDDWIRIAAVAAEEAAANPGRLFELDASDPDDVLAGKLITTLLGAAAEATRAPDRKARNVLYGATLRKAIEIALRATAGNVGDTREHLAKIDEVVRKLNELVTDNHERYGNKEWLQIFRQLLAGALDGRAPAELTTELADQLLQGAG